MWRRHYSLACSWLITMSMNEVFCSNANLSCRFLPSFIDGLLMSRPMQRARNFLQSVTDHHLQMLHLQVLTLSKCWRSSHPDILHTINVERVNCSRTGTPPLAQVDSVIANRCNATKIPRYIPLSHHALGQGTGQRGWRCSRATEQHGIDSQGSNLRACKAVHIFHPKHRGGKMFLLLHTLVLSILARFHRILFKIVGYFTGWYPFKTFCRMQYSFKFWLCLKFYKWYSLIMTIHNCLYL